MTIRDSLYGPVLAASIALGAITCASHSVDIGPDRDLAALVHTIIVDSVSAGGRKPNDVFAAADSISASVMRIAKVPIQPPIQLNCPGSTDSSGDAVTGLVGYVVRVSIAGGGDTRVVSLRKSCTYVYRGRGRGFFEALDFEVMRSRRHWSVTRRMNHVIT
jgi:hypothetical protein